MNILKTTLFAAVASVAMGGAALAQDAAKPFDVSFNVGVASDYVFRGASQTDEKPQIYGGVDTTIGSIGYAGVWASNVDFNDSTKAEIDVYAGIKPTLGPVNLDLGVIYYGYAKAPSGSNYEYVEFKVAGSVPVGPATLGAAVYYSDDFFGGTGKATYVELNGSAPLAEKLSVSGALGHQDVDYAGDYTTWNIGLGYAINDVFGVDLRYHDTNEHSLGDLYKGRVAIGLKAVF